MRRAALRAILSHWRRHPWQLLTLIGGLAMATALWSGVQAINGEARAGYDRAAQIARLSALPRLQRTDGTALTISDFAGLRRAGWPVTPVLSGTLRTARMRLEIEGIDPLTHPLAGLLAASAAGGGRMADWLTPQGVLLVESGTARRLTGDADLPPRVISPGLSPSQAITDIAVAARLLDRPGAITVLGLTGAPPGPVPEGFVLSDAPAVADVRGLTDSFHLNLTAFGFLSFAVGLFILRGGIGLAIEQRRATFRTMRAIGLPLGTLVFLLALELTLIALVSGGLGLIAGYLIAAALLPDVAATLSGLYGAPGAEGLALRPAWIAAGLSLALVGTAVAGAGALWQVARMPLLAPAMPRAWARQTLATHMRMALAGAALGLAGISAPLLGEGLWTAFALLGGLLLAAALVLPLGLTVLLAGFGRRARGPLARWFWADTQSQIPGLSLALMALMLALAANTGVGTMVASFRQAFTGFLDQRLVSDLYVTTRSDAEGQAVTEWLVPRVDAVLPISHIDTTLFGRPAEIYGIADDPVYRGKWPMLTAAPDVWEALHAGRGALVSEQLSRRARLAIGDRITLGPGWAVEVAGTYADYGNPGGQVVVALPELLARHPEVSRLYFGLRTDPDQIPALRTALMETFGLPASAMTERAAVRAQSLAIFDRTFSVTAALNVLTLAVAGFAILTSLLTLTAMRLPQLAPVWAIGISRRVLAGLELVRALTLAALTFAFALPTGLALAWVLLKVVNAEAFGWRLPMHLYPTDWLGLLALALLAAALSALWPAIRLPRLSPARLAQVFAHER